MRACEIDPGAGDGRIYHVERPTPEPGQGEVLIRLGAASLNYRDLLVMQNFYNAPPGREIPLSDGAGRIVATGPDVPEERIGQRVAAAFFPDWQRGAITATARGRSFGANLPGMLAEYAVVPAHAAIEVPPHLSDEEAATLPCAGLTAWTALCEAAQLRPGMSVLLLGSGGVSVMALQFAKIMGLRVIQTTSSPAKRARLLELGADEVIDYTAEPDWHQAVRRLTGGDGVDAVVEIGGTGTLTNSALSVRTGGTIVCVGFVTEGQGLDPKLIVGRAIRLIGISVGSCEGFAEMNRAIALHKMRPVVDRVFAMEQAEEAFALMRAGGHFGKVVISIAPAGGG
ncbi:zinc-binding dehydrogenase [Oceanicola sp. 502str15]|nr:zinc-binding dehydrogenase [Oceanicola sp. 502str15]